MQSSSLDSKLVMAEGTRSQDIKRIEESIRGSEKQEEVMNEMRNLVAALHLKYEQIAEKRKEKRLLEKDLLGHLLNFKDGTGQTLTEDQIANNIIGVLFAAQDTSASVLT